MKTSVYLLAAALLASAPGYATPRRPLPLATCLSLGLARACDRVVEALADRPSTPADHQKALKLARAAIAALRGPLPPGLLADTLARCRASECTACMQLADALESLFTVETLRTPLGGAIADVMQRPRG